MLVTVFYGLVRTVGLKVIPVIDVMNGVAVHAVRGRRKEYQPLKSVLCSSSDPLDVAVAFRTAGFSELYVADLDAICGGQPDYALLKRLIKTKFALMVDAGVDNIKRARLLLKYGVSKVIIGTETLSSYSFIREAIACFGKERVVVSLDLKGDEVLLGFEPDTSTFPLEVLKKLLNQGVEQIILLDLARVGSQEGLNTVLLNEALKNQNVKVFVGGGVRGIADLVDMRTLGVSGVLMATALHLGLVTPTKLKQEGFI
ncbi:MAG: HisA/HisF-related TIM barrel protein [Candidatus Bathyarchaeia archaeon]